jgi:hypothetical protein
VKYTFVRGLALTLGVYAIPNATFAQYSIGEPGVGLTSGAYIPVAKPGVATMMIPGVPAGYQTSQTVGSGIPTSTGAVLVQGIPNGQTQMIPATHVPVQMFPQAGTTLPTTPQYMVADNRSVLQNGGYQQAIPQPVQPHAQELVQPYPQAEASAHPGVVNTNETPYTAPTIGTSEACTTTSCGPAIQPLCPWIFGANALLFNRLDDDCTALTYRIADPTYPLLCTRLVDMPTTGGYELYGGRYFCDGRYAVIGSYWGIFSPQQQASVSEFPGTELMPALFFTYDSPWGGSTAGIRMTSQWVSDWYNQAHTHRVTREQSFQNAEVNFVSFALGGGARQPYSSDCGSCLFGRGCADDCRPGPTGACAPWYGAQCSRLRFNAFAGLRWFQFQDQLEFGASEANATFDYSADDFFYQNHVTNDLFGGQLGATATWCTGRCFNFFTGTSFGVYNNRMSLSSYAGTATEIATIVSANQFNGQQFSFTAHDNDIAFLGEGNVGTGIRISRGWTANIGYRLIGVSGVATSPGQIPRDFGNLNSAWHLKNEHSIMLHGLTLGAAYNF